MLEPEDALMHCARPQPTSSFVGLPSELIEHIIIYTASVSPTSVAAIAQTCHTMQTLIYGAPDHHLWREIFLTTFDDPRIADKTDRTNPYKPYCSDYDAADGTEHEPPFEEKPFDWCKAFCQRVRALRYFERVTVPSDEEAQRRLQQGERVGSPADNTRAMESLVDAMHTALPSPPTVVISFLADPEGAGSAPRQLPIFPPSPAVCTQSTAARSSVGQSALSSEPRTIAFGYDTAKNIRWLERATANGYPPELTLRISGRDLPGGLQGLWDDEVEGQEMQVLSRMIAFTGFIPIPQPRQETKGKEKLNGKRKEKTELVDPTEDEAGASGSSSSSDEDVMTDPAEDPEDALPASTEVVAEPGVIGTTLTYASATEPPAERETTPSYDGDDEDGEGDANQPYEDPLPHNATLPMTLLAQRRRARRLARMRVYNMQYLTRERHWGPYLLPASSKLKARDAGSELDFLSPILEIFANHDAGHPHPHGDDDDDDDDEEGDADMEFLPMGEGDLNDEHEHDGHGHGHHGGVILQFPPEPFPPPPLPSQNELCADWTYLAGVRMVVEANLREAVRPEALAGLVWLDGLRRGSAPNAVGPGYASERGQRPPSPSEESDGSSLSTGTEVEGVDGWDWAGVEGDWKRCVCWLDYRDLILHNLARQFNDPNLQEAVRIIPMRLRIDSYSPSPVPNNAHRPNINVIGETAGPAGSGSVRKIRGTIGVIADGNIRWSLYSCIEDASSAEWVTEGIQIGEATSGMGILGMWTGAQHERMDPLGPFWAWKVG